MSTVNMKVIQGLVDKATAAFDAWKVAGSFALTQHHGYSAALKANAASRAASEELRGYCNQVLTQLHADPSTDPGWFSKIGAIRDSAIYQVQTLDAAKALIEKDLAANMTRLFGQAEASSFTTPAAAAAAVDKKYQGRTPNAEKPDAQDAAAPPVDVPPSAPGLSTTEKVGLFGALGLGALWLGRKVLR